MLNLHSLVKVGSREKILYHHEESKCPYYEIEETYKHVLHCKGVQEVKQQELAMMTLEEVLIGSSNTHMGLLMLLLKGFKGEGKAKLTNDPTGHSK